MSAPRRNIAIAATEEKPSSSALLISIDNLKKAEKLLEDVIKKSSNEQQKNANALIKQIKQQLTQTKNEYDQGYREKLRSSESLEYLERERCESVTNIGVCVVGSTATIALLLLAIALFNTMVNACNGNDNNTEPTNNHLSFGFSPSSSAGCIGIMAGAYITLSITVIAITCCLARFCGDNSNSLRSSLRWIKDRTILIDERSTRIEKEIEFRKASAIADAYREIAEIKSTSAVIDDSTPIEIGATTLSEIQQLTTGTNFEGINTILAGRPKTLQINDIISRIAVEKDLHERMRLLREFSTEHGIPNDVLELINSYLPKGKATTNMGLGLGLTLFSPASGSAIEEVNDDVVIHIDADLSDERSLRL